MALAAQFLAPARQFPVQFAGELRGRMVVLCLDGQKVETTFAGKLRFRDANHAWASVCAGVRNPVAVGQTYQVRAWNSAFFGGNAKIAVNIVAANFNNASSNEQCAGLQLAVWEAMEDGGIKPDFENGRFAAHADPGVMAYAVAYYAAADKPGIAAFLQTGGSGQPQITPSPV
jgi:hypothetical protein